jgi:hypothetical protein
MAVSASMKNIQIYESRILRSESMSPRYASKRSKRTFELVKQLEQMAVDN